MIRDKKEYDEQEIMDANLKSNERKIMELEKQIQKLRKSVPPNPLNASA